MLNRDFQAWINSCVRDIAIKELSNVNEEFKVANGIEEYFARIVDTSIMTLLKQTKDGAKFQICRVRDSHPLKLLKSEDLVDAYARSLKAGHHLGNAPEGTKALGPD